MATAAADLQAIHEVSPELVLVDAALAEELRLAPATAPAPTSVAPHVVAIPPADPEPDEAAVEVAESSGGVDASDLIVGSTADAAGEPETASGYPSLPAPPDDGEVDSMEATEAALREIRARLSAQRRA